MTLFFWIVIDKPVSLSVIIQKNKTTFTTLHNLNWVVTQAMESGERRLFLSEKKGGEGIYGWVKEERWEGV